MATNKNAQLRYQILDRCFKDFSHFYTIEDLMEQVNEDFRDLYGEGYRVSLRQIRDDIRLMRDSKGYGAPIEAFPLEGRKCYYRYSDRAFSIFNNEMTVEEVANLRSTIEMLGRFRGSSANAWLEEVISNLECRFGVKGNVENVVSFDHNDQLQGLEYLSQLIDAATEHKTLRILYRTFKGKDILTIVHPYYLKQYNNRWFLFGLEENEKGKFICNKALDRILKIEESGMKFIPNTKVDFGTFFDEIVGVSVPYDDVPVERFVFRFDPKRFPYVASKPIHPSQKVVDAERCIIEIEVRPTRELEAKIFSYCPDIEVLEPQWMRESMKEKLKKNLEMYFAVQNDCIV